MKKGINSENLQLEDIGEEAINKVNAQLEDAAKDVKQLWDHLQPTFYQINLFSVSIQKVA